MWKRKVRKISCSYCVTLPKRIVDFYKLDNVMAEIDILDNFIVVKVPLQTNVTSK